MDAVFAAAVVRAKGPVSLRSQGLARQWEKLPFLPWTPLCHPGRRRPRFARSFRSLSLRPRAGATPKRAKRNSKSKPATTRMPCGDAAIKEDLAVLELVVALDRAHKPQKIQVGSFSPLQEVKLFLPPRALISDFLLHALDHAVLVTTGYSPGRNILSKPLNCPAHALACFLDNLLACGSFPNLGLQIDRVGQYRAVKHAGLLKLFDFFIRARKRRCHSLHQVASLSDSHVDGRISRQLDIRQPTRRAVVDELQHVAMELRKATRPLLVTLPALLHGRTETGCRECCADSTDSGEPEKFVTLPFFCPTHLKGDEDNHAQTCHHICDQLSLLARS